MSEDGYSSAFEQLHPALQRWIWRQGWDRLHPTQEQAAAPILTGEQDVLISAATAGGKTEAAFLPALSNILQAREAGRVPLLLYVAPLKALINDQYRRLEDMTAGVDLAVTPWHGDVGESVRKRFRENPDGVLLITPESLEAFFVHKGSRLQQLFGNVQQVVIDELHVFPGSERGRQLQSLLARLELICGRRIPRIGLSATIGDLKLAADFLRPHAADRVKVIAAEQGEQALRIQLRGYEHRPPRLSNREAAEAEERGEEVTIEDVTDGDDLTIREHLFGVLRGESHLVFANSRGRVELYADLLRRKCESESVPQEFLPHHGSLSKELRFQVEARLRDGRKPTTAICTSTLELGIDIGSVRSIVQLGTPYHVSALRQRLGRSGRRDEAAILRLYIREEELTPNTTTLDQLRGELFQATAMVELLLEGWCEPPTTGRLHLSTCIQQILSLIGQYGGVTAGDLWRALAVQGPYGDTLSQAMLKALLRAMGAQDLIIQGHDGLLLHGERGEQIVNHYHFYTAFTTPEEFTLYHKERALGTLPIEGPVISGQLLIFAGRRWKVEDVDEDRKAIMLSVSSGGNPPRFGGEGGQVDGVVRKKMRALYDATEPPRYLNRGARRLFQQGMESFRRYKLDRIGARVEGDSILMLPWASDRIVDTLAVMLVRDGFAAAREQFALVVQGNDPDRVRTALLQFVETPPASAEALAETVPFKAKEKYDPFLPSALLNAEYAARALDLPGAIQAAKGMTRELDALRGQRSLDP